MSGAGFRSRVLAEGLSSGCGPAGPHRLRSQFQFLATRRDDETQVRRGKARGTVQAAVSIVSPPGTLRCLGTVDRAAAPSLLGHRPYLGGGELGAALVYAGNEDRNQEEPGAGLFTATIPL